MVLGVSAIPTYATWSNVRRFGKMIPYYLCDGAVVHQEALEKIVRGAKDATGKRVGGAGYTNFGASFKKSLLETEQAYKGVLEANEGSFFKYAKKSLKELPGEMASGWKTAGEAAKAAGKSGLWGSIKGAFNPVLKKLPLVGSIIYAATEIPNIAKATADGGLVAGAAETVKAGGRMLGFTAGAAIGQALIPIPLVGAIVGGMVGEKLASLVTGKSYTEQKQEIQEEAIAEVQGQTPAQEGVPQGDGAEEEEYIVQNQFGGTLTNKQLAELEQLQNEIIKRDSTFNVSA